MNNIWYLGDTPFVAESEENLQALARALVRAGGESGLKLNFSTTN